MNTRQIHGSQSLRTSQHFLDEHKDVVGAVNTTKARKQLDAAITTLDAVAAVQGTRTRESRAVVVGRKQLETVLIRDFMTPLSKFARTELKGVPDYAALTPSANQLRTEKLVQSARAMANAAAPLAAQIAVEFDPNFLAGLRSATEAVRAAIDTRAQKSVARSGATKGVSEALATGRAAVVSLDARVSKLIRGNGVLEREWLQARRVVKSTVPVAPPASAPVATTVPVVPTAPVTPVTPITPVTPLTLVAPTAQEVAATKVA
jgi:hypothetical protein